MGLQERGRLQGMPGVIGCSATITLGRLSLDSTPSSSGNPGLYFFALCGGVALFAAFVRRLLFASGGSGSSEQLGCETRLICQRQVDGQVAPHK